MKKGISLISKIIKMLIKMGFVRKNDRIREDSRELGILDWGIELIL